MAAHPRTACRPPPADRAVGWHRLPPELRELVMQELSAEEQAHPAATCRAAWAEDATARRVRQLVRRHRLLGQAGSLGLPALTAFTEPPVLVPGRTGPAGGPALDWAGRALLDAVGRVWWQDDDDGGAVRVSWPDGEGDGGARGWWPDASGGGRGGWWWWPRGGGGEGRGSWPNHSRLPHRPVPLVPLGGRRAVALSGGDSFVAVLCQGGDLLLWRPHWSEARLALRRVVRLAGDRTAVYALTRTGGVYAWQVAGPGRLRMWAVGAGGPHWEPTPAALSAARQLSVQDRPAQLAVAQDDRGSVASVYVVDRTGRAVWGCGDETLRHYCTRHVMLTPLPSPPEPIRHLLALGVGLHRRVVPADGDEDALRGRVERYRGANGIGPLALLEDGSLWSPILARRLPLLRAGRVLGASREGRVLGMARDAAEPAQVRLLTAAGEHLTARLSESQDGRAWLEVSAALDRPAARGP